MSTANAHLSLQSHRRNQIRGISLVELMVAMVIGLAVIAVGSTSYLNVAANTRSANVLAQMNEDANAALSILRTHVLLAGYSRPLRVYNQTLTVNGAPVTETKMRRAYQPSSNNDFIVGCDNGFVNGRAHELQISLLGCNQKAGPDALAVVYEADASNTYPTSAGRPTDCLNNALPTRPADANGTVDDASNAGSKDHDVILASNKFYLDTGPNGNSELYCLGNGRGTISPADDTLPSTGTGSAVFPQPLVENIYDLQILYGVADITGTGANAVVNKNAVAYLSATDLNSLTGSDKWNRVVSARICIEVRSAVTVNTSEQTKYVNCQGVVSNPPDSTHLVRTFTTTVVLHNRI